MERWIVKRSLQDLRGVFDSEEFVWSYLPKAVNAIRQALRRKQFAFSLFHTATLHRSPCRARRMTEIKKRPFILCASYYFCVEVLLLTAVADRVIWMKGVRTR